MSIDNQFSNISLVSWTERSAMLEKHEENLLQLLDLTPISLSNKWENAEYMKGLIPSDEDLTRRLHPDNLNRCTVDIIDGFIVVENIDWGKDPTSEIKLAITHAAERQHVHRICDSYFIFIDGTWVIESGENKIDVCPWDHVQLPRRTLHGFVSELEEKWDNNIEKTYTRNFKKRFELFCQENPNVKKEGNLVFISIQNPPLSNPYVKQLVSEKFWKDHQGICDLWPVLEDGAISSIPETYQDITT